MTARSASFMVPCGTDGTETTFFVLTCDWDGAQYTAVMASHVHEELRSGLFRTTYKGEGRNVAQRGAQRFNARAWRKFVDENVAAFEVNHIRTAD